MSIRWIWICDGVGCDVRHEIDGARESNLVSEHSIRLNTDTLWRGHLCAVCSSKVRDGIKTVVTAGKEGAEQT